MRKFSDKAEEYVDQNKKRSIWKKAASVAAGMVVFCTTYALILPAITKERPVFCGFEETHMHDKSCYVKVANEQKIEMVCSLETPQAHTHDDSCKDADGNLICTLPEIAQHIHTDSCYAEMDTIESESQNESVLIPGHTHSDACYTMQRGELICQTAEGAGHTHTDACRGRGALICSTPENHVHGDGCYTAQRGDLICGQAESAGHSHDSGCYDEAGGLICGQAEAAAHTHGDGCYSVNKTLVCGTQEGHVHSDSCYESAIVCGQTEASGHTHGDDCYAWNKVLTCGQEETPDKTETRAAANAPAESKEKVLICTEPTAQVHVHSDACFKTVQDSTEQAPLTCEKEEGEEHKHEEYCYGDWKLVCEKEEHEHDLSCYSDPEADVEKAEDWEKTFEDAKLNGVWAHDVLLIAESQLDYHESTQNYEVEEDGKTINGYTRYGAWYGMPYEEWCAMFASFCLHYAEVEDMPLEAGCPAWIEKLSQEKYDLYEKADEYTPVGGDLIFFDWDGDNVSDHVGIVAEVIPASDNEPEKVKTIEGNSSKQVKYNTYKSEDEQIMGYGKLPVQDGGVYDYSDDQIQITAEFPDGSEVARKAVLEVTSHLEGSEAYETLLQQAELAAGEELAKGWFYDLGLTIKYKKQEQKEAVSAGDETVKMTLRLNEKAAENPDDVIVFGYMEDGTPATLSGVTVSEEQNSAGEAVTVLSFENSGLDSIGVTVRKVSDPTADTETAADWEESFADAALTGVWAEDTAAIAESQIGYRESVDNYQINEESGAKRGYTRYGAWYGEPYAEWNTVFAAFCLNYADAKTIPVNISCSDWIAALSAEEYDLYRSADAYTPKRGDLIFIDSNEDGVADRVGITAELIPETEEAAAQIKTVEGDVYGEVQYVTYDAADAQIQGYGIVEFIEAPAETGTEENDGLYIYSDEQIYVEVQLPVDTEVPADAVLSVVPVEAEHEKYEEYVEQAEQAVGAVSNIALYDISFYTAGGTYIPVSDNAKVSMAFVNSPVDIEAEIQVLHFNEEEEAPQTLEEIDVSTKEITMLPTETLTDVQQAQVEQVAAYAAEPTAEEETVSVTDNESEVQSEMAAGAEVSAKNEATEEIVTEVRDVVEFVTDGFSTFAVVQVETGVYVGKVITPKTRENNQVEGIYDTITGLADDKKKYIIVSADKNYALSSYVNMTNGEDRLKGMEVLTSVGDTVSVHANKHLLWEFEGTNKEGQLYIKNVGNGEYLQLVRNGVAITSQLSDEESIQNKQMIYGIKADNSNEVGFCVQVGNEYYYLNKYGGNAFYGFAPYQSNFTNPGNHFLLYECNGYQQESLVTHIVANDQVDNLAGRTLVVSSDVSEYTMSTDEIIINPDTDKFVHRAGIDMEKDATTVTVSSIKNVQWEFVAGDDTSVQNDYHIKVKDSAPAQYLNVSTNGQTVDISENPQNIYVTAIEDSDNAVTLRTAANAGRYLAFNADGNHSFASYGKPVKDAEHLILSEVEDEVRATDLGGKAAFIVAVNNEGDGKQPAVASKTNNTAVRVPQEIINGGTDLDPAVIDEEGILGWYFEPTNTPGVYHIVATCGANAGKYMNLRKSDNGILDFIMQNTAQDIEVVKANTSGTDLDVTENVISLRAKLDDNKYYYLHLGNDSPNSVRSGFQCKAEGQKNFTVAATHFQLVEIKEVTNVVDKINTLLDNMIQNKDGSWSFSSAAKTGSAAEENEPTNQGKYGENYQQPFMDDYDQAQAYRREMQLLAREIRQLYAELTPAEQRYVWRYDIVDSSEDNGKDLKWLWDEVKTVSSNDPVGVKVELFNYDDSVNNTGLAYGRGAEGTDEFNDPKGFTFYHKVQYDEYTQVDKGRDEKRNGGTLGSDNTELKMSQTLDKNGYPEVIGGTRADEELNTENNGDTGSLQYLFDPNGKYHVATMSDGGGLFQKDSEGFYYYYCNQNAASYDKGKNKFTLYDTVIRPMYIHGAVPDEANDVYNFLPFNNPDDDLIFDVPDTIDPNNELTGYISGEHTANTTKTGYLNERSDMWFGMTIELDFLMPENGQLYYYNENNELDHVSDMIFDFYGDDDVWVYIDGVLVLDIGGVHGAEKGSINFKTGAVSYEDNFKDKKNVVTKTLAEIFKGTDTAVNSSTFADYTHHKLKFFYMERGGNVSYCGLKFNMPTMPDNYLMVEKQLAKAENNNNNNTVAADVIGDKYYTFRVVQANDNGKPIDQNGDETDRVADMVSFFEPYASFEVYQGGAPTGMIGKTSEDGYFSVKAGYQAVFSDMLNRRSDETKTKYVVLEILAEKDMEQLGYITYTVSNLEDNTNTGTDPSAVVKQDIKRDDLGIFMGEKISGAAYTNGVDVKNSTSIKFTNVLKEPDSKLAITKMLGDGVDKDQYSNTEFTIKLEFGDYAIMETAESTEDQPKVERGIIYSPVAKGTPYTLYDKSGDIIKTEDDKDFWEVTSTDGTITLKPGQKAVFDKIVAGTYYRVSEQLDDSGNWMPTYTGQISKINENEEGEITPTGPSFEYPGGNANGTFGYQDYVEVTIVNTNYSVSVEIPIKKKVEYASMTDNFTFNVQWVRMKDEDNDGKLDDGATYDLKWVNELINNTTKTDADKYYSLPGANITVTPETAKDGAVGKVTIGFPDISLTNGHAYYKISEQPGKGSYIYDTNYYIVEVTLNKNATNAADKAKITGIWKNGTGDNLVPNGNTAIAALDFVNHRTTSLEVSKEVENGNTRDIFSYNYTVKYPDNSDQVYTSGNFTLIDGGKHTITGIPLGAIVEVKETDTKGYLPSYNVTAVYEAEYGTINNATVAYNTDASAGAYVGDIKGNTQTVTIPVYTNQGIGADITFRYAQQDSRKFFVDNTSDNESGIEYTFTSTGGWQKWEDSKKLAGPYMSAGNNELQIGGVNGEYAPNLDNIKLTFGRVQGDTAAVNILGDGSAIHFVNKPAADVTISKTVVGSDLSGKFTFVATIKDAAGNPITSVTTGDGEVWTNSNGRYEFRLTNEASLVFKKLPIGATIQVEETDKGNALNTYYTMTTRLEAEDGTLKNVTTPTSGEPSGGYFVGNIKGNTGTVTIPFQVKNIWLQALHVGYGTLVNRDFVITVNDTATITLSGLNSGDWYNWAKTACEVTNLKSGSNTLTFGGNGSADAPNLDYIELVWENRSTDTGEEYINGNTEIHFTNESGYDLPESGGTGTHFYTLWGFLLTAVPLMYGYSQRRKRERRSA